MQDRQLNLSLFLATTVLFGALLFGGLPGWVVYAFSVTCVHCVFPLSLPQWGFIVATLVLVAAGGAGIVLSFGVAITAGGEGQNTADAALTGYMLLVLLLASVLVLVAAFFSGRKLWKYA